MNTLEVQGALSQRFCYIFVKMAQIFGNDKEPFFWHEIAVTAPGRKYPGIILGGTNYKQFLTTTLQYTPGTGCSKAD